jgi:hypothetical protein
VTEFFSTTRSAWDALEGDERFLDAIAGIGLDCADFKERDGRLTVWCGGGEGEALEQLRAALPWVRFEVVNGRAAVVVDAP